MVAVDVLLAPESGSPKFQTYERFGPVDSFIKVTVLPGQDAVSFEEKIAAGDEIVTTFTFVILSKQPKNLAPIA